MVRSQKWDRHRDIAVKSDSEFDIDRSQSQFYELLVNNPVQARRASFEATFAASAFLFNLD